MIIFSSETRGFPGAAASYQETAEPTLMDAVIPAYLAKLEQADENVAARRGSAPVRALVDRRDPRKPAASRTFWKPV